jgi:hypothetical protein
MSVVSASRSVDDEADSSPEREKVHARGWIGWSSVLFALLQSVCTLLMAMAGLRLALGIGTLALSAQATALMTRLHADWLRIPMVSLALIGALFNLAAILQIRRLRQRPASQWRLTPVPARKLRMERWQIALSAATLVLIALEESFHLRLSGHL